MNRQATSLPTLMGQFLRQPSALMLVGAFLLSTLARLSMAAWSGWDLLLAGAVIALWPLHEWALHVYVLHGKPLHLFGRTLQLGTVTEHAAHHADPSDLELGFIEPRALVWAGALYTGAWLLLSPELELGLTGLTATTLLAVTYEWTHYLLHTDHRPRTQLYRRLWISHRRHHFKNENYWYGVTMLSGDRLLGTRPTPAEVETSKTCRTLGIDPEAAL